MENTKERIISELEEGLSEITDNLNKKRSIFNILSGQKYSLRKSEGNKFQIVTNYENLKNKSTGIATEIRFENNVLNGIVVPIKSLKSIASFLHSLSHKYNISLGTLSDSINAEYFSF